MNLLQDQHILVLGLGESGLAMARWCARHGAQVRVWDSRDAPPHAQTLREAVPDAQLWTGALESAALHGMQRVLKSPGLSPLDARIAPLLTAARAQGIAVQGELDLFIQALAELKAEHGYAPQVLAITGTNGKTTVTALAALLVERAGKRVAAAGNIGPTMLDTLASVADPAELPEVWVLELSSFQLDGVQGFEPNAATVLNLSQDHLDWHGTMAAYAQAKAHVFGTRGAMVINRDDPQVEAMTTLPPPRSPKGRAPKARPRRLLRFGLDAPHAPGDFGLVVENGMAWLVRALESDTPHRRRPAEAVEASEIHLQRLMPADALHIRGRHNAANALAALALAVAIGCPLAPMLHGLREYHGEPHRVSFVAALGEVEAFDDSKGTNVGATVAALLGLGADKAPGKLVVILGGDGKGQDFASLADPIKRHARSVALIGRDAGTIGSAIAASGVATQTHATLQAATRWCFEQARPGDAVLLSPACASLDMFRDYAHRAEVFVAEVQAIAAEQGGVA
jgi:UDP-N-acetylmuramoylalanine--D-glutamate ligase